MVDNAEISILEVSFITVSIVRFYYLSTAVYLHLDKEMLPHTVETFSLQVYGPTHTRYVLRFQ